MHSATRHIIQRQTVLVDQPSLAFGVQERLSAYCRYQLPGLLESLFDRVADEHTVIRLDTLDIDVGSLPMVDFENQLTQQISQQLEQELNRILHNPQASDGRVERYSQADVIGRQFYFFLQHGYLPPWANTTAIEQISDWLIRAEAAPFRAKLVALLRHQPTALSRLIAHCSDEALISLCTTPTGWSGKPGHLFDCLHREINQLPRYVIRACYWHAVFGKLEGSGDPTDARVLMHFYESLYVASATTLVSATLSTVPLLRSFFQKLQKSVRQGTQGMPDAERSRFIDSLQQLVNQTNGPRNSTEEYDTTSFSGKPLTKDLQSDQPSTISADQVNKDSLINRNSPTEIDSDNRNVVPKPTTNWPQTKPLIDGEEIYVPLAGIVLLHPFLSILFTEHNLIHNKAWVSSEASVKGTQLLTYLATGTDRCPEYKLPLVKLLCGLPFDTFVSPEIMLTEAEKLSAVEVLEAIISHWQALGTTSPAGLRESFLQREGKLTAVESGWRLTVERKTIDILLNRLPWGLSMIKLPWMSDLLFVDWA
ncbi:hypothetical protein IC229_08935 [Spirosoma sp. BT702]|uniref:Uncharacterized protein n=1 Tax=Spirosoma profusum TaxID=2771354 RepID=A0A926Y291_9BACT|nr:contractile injection system tape measure protein [Spirosoma profusum]MBD2700760.1 hypothetical protein [Spirosoma profusum]